MGGSASRQSEPIESARLMKLTWNARALATFLYAFADY